MISNQDIFDISNQVICGIEKISNEINQVNSSIQKIGSAIETQYNTATFPLIEELKDPYESYKAIYQYYINTDILNTEERDQLITLFKLNNCDYRRTILAFEQERERKLLELSKKLY